MTLRSVSRRESNINVGFQETGWRHRLDWSGSGQKAVGEGATCTHDNEP